MPYTDIRQIYSDLADEIEQYDLQVTDHVIDVETFAGTYKEYVMTGFFDNWSEKWDVKIWFRYRRSNDAWYVEPMGYLKGQDTDRCGGIAVREEWDLYSPIIFFSSLDDALQYVYDNCDAILDTYQENDW